jgi:cellobiose phosphorylase
LEGGDWNDTLDMAREKGESVCFHSFYAYNLKLLIDTLKVFRKKGVAKVFLLSEATLLLDRLPEQKPVDYSSPDAKHIRLKQYFDHVSHNVVGNKVGVDIDGLISDLEAKSEHMVTHIQKNEWITTESGYKFFNGHYDNRSKPVDGDHSSGIRMDLTSQVMPVLCDVAGDNHIKELYKSIQEFLKDADGDGLRLCTDFSELDLQIGRITGFVYGNKEHGSKWMQQNIMLAYGLYKRGFIHKGYEVINEVYRLCNNSAVAKIFPGIPSYFDNQNRGAYAYLTGSSSWFILTLTTQIFGVRGEKGDLCIEPKLVKAQFDKQGNAGISFNFHQIRISLTYINKDFLDFGSYRIREFRINEKKPEYFSKSDHKIVIKKEIIEELSYQGKCEIQVYLVKII